MIDSAQAVVNVAQDCYKIVEDWIAETLGTRDLDIVKYMTESEGLYIEQGDIPGYVHRRLHLNGKAVTTLVIDYREAVKCS
jgi:hypothetical protein